MFCAISGEVPQVPVISTKTGHLYEKHIIEKHLRAEAKCPMTGVEMTEDDLMTMQINKALRPRALVATSIPGLLSNMQNEWDEVMLETFALKSQLDSTRQELAQALYQHDASCRVIARLMRERDEARAMLAAAASSGHVPTATAAMAPAIAGGSSGTQPMEVSGDAGSSGAFSADIVAALNKKCGELSGARKGRSKVLEAAGVVLAKDALANWQTLRSFTPHKSDKGAIHCVAAYSTSSSSSSGAGGSSSDVLLTGGLDCCVMVVDAVSGSVLSKLTGHAKKVNSVALRYAAAGAGASAGDDNDAMMNIVAFSGSADKTIKMWSQSSASLPAAKRGKGAGGGRKAAPAAGASEFAMSESACYTFHTGEVTSLALHPTGDYLLSTSTDGSWGFVDIEANKCVGQVSLGNTEADQLLCGQLHPDGLLYGTGTAGGVLKIWDIREQKSVLEFASPAVGNANTGAAKNSVRCVSFSENGYLLAAGGDDGGAHIWDLRKLKTIKTIESVDSTVSALCFDYSATYLAMGTADGHVRVAVVKDWSEPLVLNGLHTKGVSALCWGGQAAVGVGGRESYLVSCSLDRTLKVIGVPTA